ncbi:MAG: ABC transporter ATP-binding protein [Hyphomonadaceae bacterium]|nr:ABC transporter ATP-binding protein [Hyphomonadaceae bacterium]
MPRNAEVEMAELKFDHVHMSLGQHKVLNDISMRVSGGELVALVGPNGAGKTSLLRAGLGLCRPVSGSIYLDDIAIARYSLSEMARKIAYLPQTRALAWPLDVQSVVQLGRYAYGGALAPPNGTDHDAIERALSACNLKLLKKRNTATLSGGEMARVHIARALVSETPLLIADEPNAALDPRHAHEMMGIIKAYCQNGGGALVSLHDLNLASLYGDRVIVLHEGQIVADAAPQQALFVPIIGEDFWHAGSLCRSGIASHAAHLCFSRWIWF